MLNDDADTEFSPDDEHLSVRHANPEHEQVVLVDWMLGNSCNFECSYCPAALHDGSIRWQSADDVLAMFKTLRSHYMNALKRRVWLQFTGGEPTQHPKMPLILEEARQNGFNASLISNGSRTVRYWEKIAPLLDAAIMTFHDEFVKNDHFVEIALLLCETMPVQINITMHPDRFDQIYETAHWLSENVPAATIVMKPLREDFGSQLMHYSKEQLEKLGSIRPKKRVNLPTPRGVMRVTRRNGREENLRANALIVNGENRWRDFMCEAGIESLRIKADGKVFRAVCGVGGEIGQLGDDDLWLPVSSILCGRDRCSCVADILITKKRIDA